MAGMRDVVTCAPAGKELAVLSVALALSFKQRVRGEQDVKGRLAAVAGRELRKRIEAGGTGL